jgi:hypothetical protein
MKYIIFLAGCLFITLPLYEPQKDNTYQALALISFVGSSILTSIDELKTKIKNENKPKRPS